MTLNRKITIRSETWALNAPFVIARGSRTQTHVVVVEVQEGSHKGRGECSPNARYGETIPSVIAQIENIQPLLEGGLDLEGLQNEMPAGAARNAVDCALWDLRAKVEARPVSDLLNVPWPENIASVQTLSIGVASNMGVAAAKLTSFPILKVKLDANDIMERLSAIHQNAPGSGLLIDANESWTVDIVKAVAARAEEFNIVMIEQPLPEADDSALKGINIGVPLGADESCHTSADLDRLKEIYDVINIKLDKTGGLSEAMKLYTEARQVGLDVMVGCMLGTSLSMAPAMFVAQFAKYVDLDATTMLLKDRTHNLVLKDGLMSPLNPELWGGNNTDVV